jgi:hypothetical protein
MSINAGQILHVGGNNVIERIQSAGLGTVRVGFDVVREVGNPEVVDKVAQDPDFTFTVETFDVSTEVEAWLTGKRGDGTPAGAPGASDPDGTEYRWEDCGFLNVTSPWKDSNTASAGAVNAGHLIPAYYATRIQYQFGVTDDARQTVELGGGSYYYGEGAPVEDEDTGDGVTTAFPSDHQTLPHRIGGAGGTSFKRVFGVLVDGELQTEGVDYTQSPDSDTNAVATVTFTTAPRSGAKIRFTYFTPTEQDFPQAVHSSVLVKPAAVRGRNICVFLGSGGARAKLGSVQSFSLDATVDSAVEREFCNTEIVGRTVNGRDTNGDVVVRAKDKEHFFALVSKVTGIARGEVVGWLNENAIPLEVQIQNPRDPAAILKTLYVSDAIFTVPGTDARVNQPTDFTFHYESRRGSFSAFKGAKP